MLAEEVKEDLEALLQKIFNKYKSSPSTITKQIFIFCAQCNSTLIDSWIISISLSEKQDGRLCLKSGCQTFFLKNIFSPKTGSHGLVEKWANVGVDISDLVKSH